MGRMKWMSQMIQDGSFDDEFMPAYKEAVDNDKPIFTYGGTKYSTGYAKAIVAFADGFRDNIEELKKIER